MSFAGKTIVKHIVDLLLYQDVKVGLAAKQALLRAVRPKKGKSLEILENAMNESDEETVVPSIIDCKFFTGRLRSLFMKSRDF